MSEALTKEEAVAMLAVVEDYDAGNGPERCVHTMTPPPFMLGAHWSYESVVKLIEENGATLADDMATAMGHGLVTTRENGRALLLETRRV